MSLRSAAAATALALFAAATPAAAQFAAFVLPARFELKAKPGDKLAEVLEIGNDEVGAQEYRIRTADWDLRPDGAVDFRADKLDADSCRPWVAIERHLVKLSGKSKRRYRFEVQVPKDAPERLCRFALLIESADDARAVAPQGGIQLPIQGRIGIIVYVRVGNVAPDLKLERLDLVNVNGKPTPVAYFRNNGRAHGRPEGTLTGTDANGKQFDFTVAPSPILPGEVRAVPIWPQDEPDGKPAVVAFPVRLRGTVEWEGGKQPVDATLGPANR
jgi:fimbrial chaperone protein